MIPKERVSATLGVDIETAGKAQIIKRLFEYCREMADCYDAETNPLEYEAFESIAQALNEVFSVKGGGNDAN